MAKPSSEITKSEFKDNYNVVKIFNDKLSIMKQLETFNPNNQAVAFGIKKKPRDTMPAWFKEWSENFFRVYKADINSIKSRLDNIVAKNNLIE